jgi:hypothetical protein
MINVHDGSREINELLSEENKAGSGLRVLWRRLFNRRRADIEKAAPVTRC